MTSRVLEEYVAKAEAGDAEALRRLGLRYLRGDGIAQDKARGVQLFRLAAERGDAVAMYDLGYCHEAAEGAAQDWSAALRWYRAAAAKGDADAMFRIGIFFQLGRGVAADAAEAHRWYERGAAAGSVQAILCLAMNLEFGVPRAGVAKDEAAALRWYVAAADAGDAEAMRQAGLMIGDGRGAERDLARSTDYLRRAAEAGDIGGAKHYADNLRRGWGVERDLASAIKWYSVAAEAGELDALHYLGVTYDLAGPLRDPRRAVECASKAAAGGYPDALLKMAGCHEIGRHVPVDPAKTVELCEAAAAGGSGCAMFNLARWSRFGMGRPVDLAAASALYEKAERSGCSCASDFARNLRRDPSAKADRARDPLGMHANSCSELLKSAIQALLGLGVAPSAPRARFHVDRYRMLDLRGCTHRILAEGLGAHLAPDQAYLSRLQEAAAGVNFEAGTGIENFAARVMTGSPAQSTLLLRALASIASSERWPSYYAWRRASIVSEMGPLGLTPAGLAAATADFGLRYNALSDAGVLVPGKLDPRTWARKDGVCELLGLEIKSRGATIKAVSLIGGHNARSPILVTTEDLLVAFALVYNGLLPSLSLEDLGKHPFDPRTSLLRRKVFRPEWLAATDFGRALYFADWLMGQGELSTVSVVDPLGRPDDKTVGETMNAMAELIFSHTPSTTDSGRVMLYLVGVTVSTRATRSWTGLKTTRKYLENVEFRVDGSGIDYLSGGGEDRSVGLNDPDVAAAHTGLMLTSRYASLCRAYPVFARVRALLAMTRIVAKFKEDGLLLSAENRAMMQSAIARWSERAKSVPLVVANW